MSDIEDAKLVRLQAEVDRLRDERDDALEELLNVRREAEEVQLRADLLVEYIQPLAQGFAEVDAQHGLFTGVAEELEGLRRPVVEQSRKLELALGRCRCTEMVEVPCDDSDRRKLRCSACGAEQLYRPAAPSSGHPPDAGPS